MNDLIQTCNTALKTSKLEVPSNMSTLQQKVKKIYDANWSSLTWTQVVKQYGTWALSSIPKVGTIFKFIVKATDKTPPGESLQQLYRSSILASFYFSEIKKNVTDNKLDNIASNAVLFCKCYKEAKDFQTSTQEQLQALNEALKELQPLYSGIMADLPLDRFTALGGTSNELQKLN